MRILYLADVNSFHTEKLIGWAIEAKHEVGIFSLSTPRQGSPTLGQNIRIWHPSLFCTSNRYGLIGFIFKLMYLFNVIKLVSVIFIFKPQIIHAHFASSYGFLARLVKVFCPYIVSIWGTDLTVFPQKSFLHKFIIKTVLSNAKKIAATSIFLKEEGQRFTHRQIAVTPFGVDLSKFSPLNNSKNSKLGHTIICTKSLEPIYGQEILIEALIILKKRYPKMHFRLDLVGDGSQMQKLKQHILNLGLSKIVHLHGRIPNNQIPHLLKSSSIAVFPTTLNSKLAIESFGVSALEAQACKVPVIASKSGGFLEICGNGEFGALLDKIDAESIAEKIVATIENVPMTSTMVEAAYKNVEKNYAIDICKQKYISLYY